jgi:hypothetical protein
VRLAPGRYRIESANGGRCLDVTGVSAADGAPLQLWDWLGGGNQQWDLAQIPLAEVLRQRIQEGAYARWVERGRPLWNAGPDWAAAELDVLHQHVQLDAYLRFEQRGRQGGHALDDWLAAERAWKTAIAAARR